MDDVEIFTYLETTICERVDARSYQIEKCSGQNHCKLDEEKCVDDRKMPIKLKHKFYKTVVKYVMKYGAVCWARREMRRDWRK